MRPVHETILPWESRGITFIGDPHTFKSERLTEQLRSDLQGAKERGDLIAIWGDIAEWIVSSDLKRYCAKHNVRVDAYVNRMVADLADFYEPFANHIEIMKLGNHETAFIKHHHVDPMAMLIQELNRRRDPALLPIFYGGYTMWWLVKFVRTSEAGNRLGSQSVKIWMHHGAGGAAPVTKGVIDRARIQDSIWGADVYVIGHKHNQASVPVMKEECDDYGNVSRRMVDFIEVAGYSGWEQDAPDVEDGYMIDWSSENFYGLEATGCARVVLIPSQANRDGRRAQSIKRRVEVEVE